MANCYCCEKEIDDSCLDSTGNMYELKTGGKVEVCFLCENDELAYLKIKKDCLIDGIAYEVTPNEKKNKNNLIKYKDQQARDEVEWDSLMESDKKVYWFCNRGSKEFNHHSALRYANEFLCVPEGKEEDSLKRFKFNYIVEGVNEVYLEDVVGLKWVKLILDSVSVSEYQAKKPEATKWTTRTRKWYSGRCICSESFYNTTFGFAWYDKDNKYSDVYTSYQFLCSKSWKLENLVKEHIISQLK